MRTPTKPLIGNPRVILLREVSPVQGRKVQHNFSKLLKIATATVSEFRYAGADHKGRYARFYAFYCVQCF